MNRKSNIGPVDPKKKRQRGSVMVELALSFLGFGLLVFGIMDFGWAIMIQTFCYAEAQDAVRWASVRGSESSTPATGNDVYDYVISMAAGIPSNGISVETKWFTSGDSAWSSTATGHNTPGSNVKVTVSYNFSPLSGVAIKKSMTLTATANTVINN